MKNRRDRITTLIGLFAGIAFAAFATVAATAQVSTEAQITVGNSGSPQASRTLKFGVNPAATLGIDAELGEDAFPPFPPTAVFEARFVSNGGSELGEGSPADVRPYTSSSQKDEYKIKFQPGSNGLPVTLIWDMNYLKDHYTSVSMKDPFGGVIVSIDMLAVATAEITNANLTELVIEATGPKSPGSGVDDASADRGFSLRSVTSPVDGRATIAYSLDGRSDVTLSIMDVRGEAVLRIAGNLTREAGTHEENVDVTALAAGLYFVTLESLGRIDTRPMTVVR